MVSTHPVFLCLLNRSFLLIRFKLPPRSRILATMSNGTNSRLSRKLENFYHYRKDKIMEEFATKLYQLAQREIVKNGGSKMFASVWTHNVRTNLHTAIGDLVPENEPMLPFIFGSSIVEYTQLIVNEYWFWRFAAIYAMEMELHDSRDEAIKRSISELRNTQQRLHNCRNLLLTGAWTSDKESALAMATGFIVWNSAKDTWILNPLSFHHDDLAKSQRGSGR